MTLSMLEEASVELVFILKNNDFFGDGNLVSDHASCSMVMDHHRWCSGSQCLATTYLHCFTFTSVSSKSYKGRIFFTDTDDGIIYDY
jgi:hypothetical protein